MPGRRRNPSKVLIGPTEVAGVAQGLQQGLEQIGIASELVLESQHPFHYAAREAPSELVRAWKWAGTQARKIPMRQLWLKGPMYAWHRALGWPVLGWALFRYDAFVFLFGNTLTNTRFELWLMRKLGRPVVIIFLGSDARPAYINGAWQGSSIAALQRAVRRQKRKLRWLERGATACVNAPSTAHFHERPVINWFALGFPRDISEPEAPHDVSERTDVPAPTSARIVHSPSNPQVKGTALIEATVDRLRRRGFDLEFVTLKGLTNDQVLAAIRRCDLVVDQLYSDTPMAGLATEAALLGKPTLVGGYSARDIQKTLGGMPQPPTRFVDPDRFEQALEELVGSAAARRTLAGAARRFVESEWSCRQVAQRLLLILRDEAPGEWWFDPARVDYLAGCGMSEDAARERVRRLIAHAGVGALELTDKPALERAFVHWAGARAPIDAESNGGAL